MGNIWMLFLKKWDKYKAYLTYIYAYYVMPLTFPGKG